MPRRLREQSPYGYYHLTNRGPGKTPVFRDAQDRDFFLKCVELAHHVCEFSLVSFCIMTTHFHLVIQCDGLVPPAMFQSIGARYSLYHHRKYGVCGQIFHGRFHCEVIKSKKHLFSAIRYVWRNPLKARMCERLEEYPWSSFNLLGLENGLVDNRLLLSLMSEDDWRIFALQSTDDRHIEPFCKRLSNRAARKVIRSVCEKNQLRDLRRADRKRFRIVVSRCVYDGVTIPQLARHIGQPASTLYKSAREWGDLQAAPCSFAACTSP